MNDAALIVFLKSPEKGQVKTRLSRDLDDDFVLELYKSFICDLLEALEPVENKLLYVWPPFKKESREKIDFESFTGKGYDFFSQQGEDLGEKMANAFDSVFQRGYERVVLIGTDIPEITCDIVLDAYGILDTKKAVIAPASDGGYYLIGFRRSGFSRKIFDQIDWSTSEVWKQTLDRLKQNGISFGQLPKLEDIDTLEDLNSLALRVKNGRPIGKKTQSMLNCL